MSGGYRGRSTDRNADILNASSLLTVATASQGFVAVTTARRVKFVLVAPHRISHDRDQELGEN
jgi:hypothetical protein